MAAVRIQWSTKRRYNDDVVPNRTSSTAPYRVSAAAKANCSEAQPRSKCTILHQSWPAAQVLELGSLMTRVHNKKSCLVLHFPISYICTLTTTVALRWSCLYLSHFVSS